MRVSLVVVTAVPEPVDLRLREIFSESELSELYMLHPKEYSPEGIRTEYGLSRLLTRRLDWKVYQTLLERGAQRPEAGRVQVYVSYSALDGFINESGQPLSIASCHDERSRKRRWFFEQVRELLRAEAPELAQYLLVRGVSRQMFVIGWADATKWEDLPSAWEGPGDGA